MGEELLGVGVDEGDRELVSLGIGNCREHFISSVYPILFCHAFLELRKHAVDEREVLFCRMIGSRICATQQDCLVSLWVEFDTDDVWLFFIKDCEECRGEVKDMACSNKGDHDFCLQIRWCLIKVCVQI